MKIIGASVGDCVHVQGVYNFLRDAEEAGHETVFLGPAVSIERLIEAIKKESPDAVAISYRLTPRTAEHTLCELKSSLDREGSGSGSIDFLFGGTPPVAEVARRSGLFRLVSDGNNPDEVRSYLKQGSGDRPLKEVPPQDVIGRMRWKKGAPLVRTHFGLPDLDDTIGGIGIIAESGLIDVVSLGTDQDAQASFYHPEMQDAGSRGAGGVPVRLPDDFRRLFAATRKGNFPLMRTYAGTDDLIRLAEMYEDAFGNAWAAVPVFWFNAMDRRGPHSLEESVREHLKLIRWNAERGIPVEVLEAHHWAMRWAHDSLVVASAVLGAEIAKACGVKDYIHQYMFNVPPGSSFSNELAKMLAVKEMVSALEDGSFRTYTQTRTGLPSFPNDLEEARAQLASSTMLQMQLAPDIVHVVNYTEPHHAATADEVVRSARIAYHVMRNSAGAPDMTEDPGVECRKNLLKDEAGFLLRYIHRKGCITDAGYLSSLVSSGVLDAPMLKSSPFARGEAVTGFIDGGAYSIRRDGKPQGEEERISGLLLKESSADDVPGKKMGKLGGF
ncbi:cobalamin B12-binding domain-containing protein [Candidatus Woesearchaeota archaeon]|nr:cobalamin B12-binding domain-containing protein [Candidatus Woesearchaeota archaeon]